MLTIVQVQSGQLALADADGNILGIITDGGAKKLATAARLHDGSAFYKATTPSDTQPISASALPLPAGAATETTLALIKAKTDAIPTDPAKESGKLTSLETILTAIRDTAGIKKITDTVVVSGPLTDAQLRATPVPVTGSGGGGSDQVEGRGPSGSAPVGNPVYLAGQDGLLLRALLTDNQGRLIIAPSGASAPLAGFKFGDLTTSSIALFAVRRTAYTEQTSNAQRSIASASANDTAAGTGARTVEITYYTATFTGPFTETLTLNGTTGVNTVATNICYIEKIVVLTAGSGGANAGIITLYSAINKGGVAIGTIGAGDNRTFWAHHYVPTGRIAHVTSQWAGHTGTTVGSGGTFILRATSLGVAGAVDQQISDSFRLYGQSSSVQRSYGTPIVVQGPARITSFVTPETASSTNYRASFDFYEDVS